MVSDRPKVLAPIHNRPFLAYLLDFLDDAGIREVVLCTGYMANLVEETFGPTYGRMRVSYSRELTPLGTGGALRAATSHIQTDSVLVLNGDSFCEVDLHVMVAAHPPARRSNHLTNRGPRSQRFGRVQIDGEGRLLAFKEKAQTLGRVGSMPASICSIEACWDGFRGTARYRWRKRFFPPGLAAVFMATRYAGGSWTSELRNRSPTRKLFSARSARRRVFFRKKGKRIGVMIISRTPFRISFLGGGTDYPAWYREHGGAVIATTIDKYCYLTCRYLPPFFEHRYRIVYSKIENAEPSKRSATLPSRRS